MKYYWVHFKVCSHGTPWPCAERHSCGINGWTLAIKDDSDFLPYQVIGSDEIFSASDFDAIVELKEPHP